MQTEQTENSFPGPKSYRDFRETDPRALIKGPAENCWDPGSNETGPTVPPLPSYRVFFPSDLCECSLCHFARVQENRGKFEFTVVSKVCLSILSDIL